MLKRKIAWISAPAFLIQLFGCGADNLPDYVKLGGLRVLAMKADKPETTPGDTVQITPVVSDLPSPSITGGRTLSYSAEGCIDPGVALGASPSCADRPDRTVLGSGTIPSLTTATNTYTAAAPTLSVTLPATILANRTPVDQFNGVAYLVVYTLTATNPSGAPSTVTAFKRIIASTRTPLNTNPSIADVQTTSAGNQGLQAFLAALTYPGTDQTPTSFAPSFSTASAETYSVKTSDGTSQTKTEELTTTWFLSDGEIQYFRTIGTGANRWTPPTTKPTRPGVIFTIVTRDGRGGEDYKIYEQ